LQLLLAEDLTELNEVAAKIKKEVEHGYEWTKDVDAIEDLRELYRKRRERMNERNETGTV
jgi:molybdopterin converting factor small subunit